MEVHGHFICWNEEKIIPYFLRHYEQICSRIYIYDNGSNDKTISLLSTHPKVIIGTFETNGCSCEKTEIYVKANNWKNSIGVADWVIIGDMDEFIYHPNLLGELYKAHENNIGIIQATAYQMISLNYPSTQGQIYNEVRRGTRLPQYDKSQLINSRLVNDILYAPGCHAAYSNTKALWQKRSDIKLLHFKFMGLEHVYQRYQIVNARRTEESVQAGFGIHYEKTKEQLMQEMVNIWTHSELVV